MLVGKKRCNIVVTRVATNREYESRIFVCVTPIYTFLVGHFYLFSNFLFIFDFSIDKHDYKIDREGNIR